MAKQTPEQEVTQALRSHIINDPEYKAFRDKTTNLKTLGLRLPVMHEVERRGFSFYKDSPESILKTWDNIWNTSNIHETLYLALFYYRRHKKLLNLEHWRVLKRWVERIENWEHADALCDLYARMYERFPKEVEQELFKWNHSKNPWKQRCSIVGTIYYASPNRKPPKRTTVLKLIEPLIPHKDPYVQKGVGWQLREAYKLWPKEILVFLNKHATNLSATSFSYATEKLSKEDKAKLKEKRKNHRNTK